ncbi:MAG TPA: NAD(P)H-dependent oxidoreductase subunit E [Chloroflexota bacterium]|jgi:NADH:ubiquinone oxidoreductase subunit E|nr:NAD(P)H-dependent oxidoreductase subunit E [Chloroflexota bacterium]
MHARLSYDDPNWEAEVRKICAEIENVDGALMLALHRLMEDFGYISEPATILVAELLHLTPPQVFAVATYYHEFRTEKPAETTLMLCRGPACRIQGMVALRKTMEKLLGITVGERTADNKFAIESSGCLGICPHAPAMQIDHDLAGRVTPEELERLIAERSGVPV